MDAILALEPPIRLGAFLGVFTVMAFREAVAPAGCGPTAPPALAQQPGCRRGDTVVLRILFPTTAVGMALLAERHD